MLVKSTAGTRRWPNRRTAGGRFGSPGAALTFVAVLLGGACAGTSTQQVASGSESTTTADTTSSTTTPPDCASTLPTTALASQLLMVMVNDPSHAADALSDGLIGGFGLKGEQRSDVDEAITAATSDLPMPATVAVDEEGGPVQRLRYSAGRLASAQEMGEMDTTEVTSIIAEHATRMAEIGVTMNFAPVADLRNDEILDERTYSEDPDTVARYAEAVAVGNSRGGIVPVVKHWPGIGGSDTDPHESLPVLASIEELRDRDLRSFEPLMDAAPVAVMVAHAEIPDLTEPGEPASLSRRAITEELRGTEGFDGVVITDSLGMGAVVNDMTQAEAAERAISAGADIALLSGADVVTDAHEQLVRAIEDGRIPIDQVEESVRRVLAMKGIDGECFDAISAYGAIGRIEAEEDAESDTGAVTDSGINDPE
jgi:beta-N-acetylhexosaminidase